MSLTKPSQQLRRDLKDAASALESAALEIFHRAQMGEKDELSASMKYVESLHQLADRLKGYGEEVKDGRVTRSNAE
ncbi:MULTISPECIES: hypothetical protein [Pseudomonas]|uniref:Peptidase n=1 Tax=Pseudomonas sichuanensis TaxID=2213015 RepID=A0ABV0DHJ4_9PSED